MTGVDEWLANFRPRLMHTYLDDTVAAHPDRPAIDFMGRCWTWGEVGRDVEKATAGFRSLGVGPGVRVGICLPNTPYYTICYYAVLRAGGTVVNFSPLMAEQELIRQAEDAEISMLVTIDLKDLFDKAAAGHAEGAIETVVVCPLADALPAMKRMMFGLFKGGERAHVPDDPAYVHYPDLMARGGDTSPVEADPEELIALIQYTGGTTGIPKGAMLSHRNLSANMEQVRALVPSVNFGGERMVCVLPFFHVFAMTAEQNLCVLIGAEMVLLPKFELRELLRTFARTRPTLFIGVPTLFAALNNARNVGSEDLTSLKVCLSGGAPLPADVRERFESLATCVLVEGYGLTEASPVVCCTPITGPVKAGSIGPPLAGTRVEIRDVEDFDAVMPTGEKGEIVVKGPQVMQGYWKVPDETTEVLHGDWLRTGDIGYVDEDGYVYLVDRIKDIIITSGYNVYPRKIEEAIAQHPAVDEVTVIGVADAYRGQVPKAFVKLHDGEKLTELALLEFLTDRLSRLETPRSVAFRKELPKTLVGKLSKKELAAEEAASAAGAKAEAAEG
ncbi:long-chain acyl-CoA synthetase [Rhodobium orientis]|uniref:Dicarboxylate--CoA ligase PimA n=1 Tax=Rhodobium orientis TaxID=34017 RepID=A0A327JNB0_9HYPH|nr:long-chain fatty acid--CoA ligase [Rhodobium orientis]MBB4303089.1 long-chain acyl-CoA synthetase [Rhodobium orientis]MBK5948280.1 dicarboxylate--CoA ligase PimA [Rhodobium orientis]RAI24908.1 dicarboxylate--CoA ligase PimA [Rhodobium orientis]